MAAFPAHASGVVPSDHLVLPAAVFAYLGSYRGETRIHNRLRPSVFLRRCIDQDLDPLAAVPGGHRTVSAMAAGRAPLPALDGLASAVGRGRLLPSLRDRPARRLTTFAGRRCPQS